MTTPSPRHYRSLPEDNRSRKKKDRCAKHLAAVSGQCCQRAHRFRLALQKNLE